MLNRTIHQHSDDTLDVLLVEDNPGDIRLTREAFEATDTETTLHLVTDGDEAIDFLKRQVTTESPFLPALALVDLDVPGRDGRAVLEAIRDDSRLEWLPVIMLTGSADREDIEQCYGAQANAYLTKPADPDDFESQLESVVQFWCKRVQLPPVPR